MARARTLSNRIEAIEYIHADDGLPYRHDFTSSGGEIRLRDDGSVVIRNRNKKLWDTFNVNGAEQPFLVNPRGVESSTGVRTMAKKKRSNFGQRMAAARRRKNAPARRRRRAPVSAAPARRRRRRVVRASAAPARRRRRRRNPQGFSVNSIIQRATQGLVDGALVVSGKAGVRLLSSRVGTFVHGSMLETLVEAVGAIGLGMVAERIVGADRARFVMAGGFASPLETLVNQAGIPNLSLLLGDTRGVDTRIVYPMADASGGNVMGRRLGSYAQPGGGSGGAPLDAGPAFNSVVSYLPA